MKEIEPHRLKSAYLTRPFLPGGPTFDATNVVEDRFTRRGPLSHQQRHIELDVLVRQVIHDPTMERYPDDSIRYSVTTSQIRLNNAIRAHSIGPWVSYVFTNWVLLLSPICCNCLKTWVDHLDDGKCLFEPTHWKEYEPPRHA